MSEFHLIQGDLFPEPPREDRDIPGRYGRGETIHQIADRCGISVGAVRNALRDSGTKMRRPGKATNVRDDAFDAITPESSYWAGFLMADGCISDSRKHKRIVLNLHEQDADHVRAFQKFVGSTHVFSRGVTRAGCSHVSIRFTSDRMVGALAKFGIVPRKSLTAEVIGLESNRDFWRGVIDGDGCLVARAKGDGHPRILLVGSSRLVDQFRDFTRTVCPESKAAVRPLKRVAQLSFGGYPAYVITRALYENCTVALPRKLAIAREIIGRPLVNRMRKWCGFTLEHFESLYREYGSWAEVARSIGIDYHVLTGTTLPRLRRKAREAT
jgi:hypothetical protein